ncbi:MAG: GGDEF domain-containing protein [Lachnospiraceae bacterium]|nr:GGDEF domain-containing protein [Lachnospiraceae bacterium]
MTIEHYDQSIQELFHQYREYVRTADPRRPGVIKQLRKKGLEAGDDALLGCSYRLLAEYEYFVCGNYRAFHEALRQAMRHLLRIDDKSQMAQVFYLIAIDAINKGMYDISCNYFLTASNLLEREGLDKDAAIMRASVAHVLLMLGDYKESIRHTRSSGAVIRRYKTHSNYASNVVCGYVEEGTASLMLGKTGKARQCLDKAERFAASRKLPLPVGRRFDVCLFAARLALTEKQNRRAKSYLDETVALMEQLPHLADYAEDISQLGDLLIAQKKFDVLEQIIRITKKKKISADAVNARRIMVDFQTEYYLAAGKEKQLMESYRLQSEIHEKLIREQKNTYRHAQDLIRLINELRQEQVRLRSLRDELVFKAETDALTRIPNRRALNRNLEERFETAYANHTRLGVCLMDVNGLKRYNDTYGHPAGDRCLAHIGDVLYRLSKQDRIFAARYGGDEFVLICEQMTDGEIRKILLRLKEDIPINVSAGVCNAVPGDKNRCWDLLANADQALYAVKNSSGLASCRNGIRFRKLPPFSQQTPHVSD